MEVITQQINGSYESGFDDLSPHRLVAPLPQVGVEHLEQLLHDPRLRQALPVQPHGRRVRNPVLQSRPRNCMYDACAVMMRKLIESLIIEVFEGCGLAERIKTGAGDFLPLDGLIGKIIGEPSWNLSRETRRALPAVKQVGDNSAHGRRFHAHRGDIDNLRTGFRAAVQELITLGRWSDPT